MTYVIDVFLLWILGCKTQCEQQLFSQFFLNECTFITLYFVFPYIRMLTVLSEFF